MQYRKVPCRTYFSSPIMLSDVVLNLIWHWGHFNGRFVVIHSFSSDKGIQLEQLTMLPISTSAWEFHFRHNVSFINYALLFWNRSSKLHAWGDYTYVRCCSYHVSSLLFQASSFHMETDPIRFIKRSTSLILFVMAFSKIFRIVISERTMANVILHWDRVASRLGFVGAAEDMKCNYISLLHPWNSRDNKWIYE